MNSALFILKVMGTKVWLGADMRMIQNIVPGSRWDARFSVNLHPARLKHRALTLASSLGMVNKVLFPKATTLGTFLGLPNLKFFNPLVEGNPEQRTAVQIIVSRLSGSAPYLVFGPPGTGKTGSINTRDISVLIVLSVSVTLVEAIKQSWRRHPETHILATAPRWTFVFTITLLNLLLQQHCGRPVDGAPGGRHSKRRVIAIARGKQSQRGNST